MRGEQYIREFQFQGTALKTKQDVVTVMGQGP